MIRSRTIPGQLLFLLILSALPFAVIYLDGRIRFSFSLEQLQLKWEKEAERLFEETRVGISVEGQMARMALHLRRGFLRITDPSWALTGSTLVRNFRRCFPASHRPPGTLLYGFSRDQSGRVTLLSEPGLERHNGRILTDIFTWMLQPPETRPPPPLSLSRRWHALFGGNTPLGMVGMDRQGLTTNLLGQLNKTIPGLWVMRNFLAADIPFELWVFSKQPADGGKETPTFMIMWGLVCLPVWLRSHAANGCGRLEHTVLGPPRIRAEHLETTSKKGFHSRIMVSPAVADFCPSITFSRLTSEALEVVTEVVA